MSQTKAYAEILSKPEEFKQAERDLLYKTKMDEKEISREKAQEILSAFENLWNIKAALTF
ncbi:hypothetical protein GMAR_ORF230 [Golden Marseillevirus]|uniref:hypothetical protein n=1 Tax=Golden Marseillevirus TaxID=1720526 RepID=UPI000877ACAA|nr:hypothetical protein GMAR_ORF230 [Golden Marseillevirus]ALX27604.1 hypothetical protein GMAR_ORF230 [Golden Marseillevirus]